MPLSKSNQITGDWYKWAIIASAAIQTLAVAAASSAYSGATSSVATYFQVTDKVRLTLPVSMFVLGFALGVSRTRKLLLWKGRQPSDISVFSSEPRRCSKSPLSGLLFQKSLVEGTSSLQVSASSHSSVVSQSSLQIWIL